MQHTFVHVLMVAALALVISLALFTVAALDYPFKGDVRAALPPSNRCWEGSRAASSATSEG
jgi:hypothetical protein